MAATNDISDKKMLTLSEVEKLAADKSLCIMIINDRVYDATKFIDEHPGGEEVLREQHGKNASNAFEDVGHSSDAREQMKIYEIAQLHSDGIKKPAKSRPLSGSPDNGGTSWIKYIIPIVIVFAAIIYFRFIAKPSLDVNRPPKAI